jgi:hypothetical protein
VKGAVFLATAALLAMLILAPMALAQGQIEPAGTPTASASSAPKAPLEDTGGSAILLPAAVLLFGSGILTYAILRRR